MQIQMQCSVPNLVEQVAGSLSPNGGRVYERRECGGACEWVHVCAGRGRVRHQAEGHHRDSTNHALTRGPAALGGGVMAVAHMDGWVAFGRCVSSER